MIHEDDQYDVECPDCGSSRIEVLQWVETDTATAHAAAECRCGFKCHWSDSARGIQNKFADNDFGEIPVEHIHNGESGQHFEARIDFSPRLFLAQAD